MSKAEKFIHEHTRNCSNQYDFPERFENGIKRLKEYQPWLTPDDARMAVEIAKEELLEEICVWLHHNADIYGDSLMQHYNDDRMIEDLKQAMNHE